MRNVLLGAALALALPAWAAAPDESYTIRVEVSGLSWPGGWGGKITKALQGLDGSAKVKRGGSKDGVYTFEVTVSEKVGVDAAKLAGAVKGFKLERANTELVGDASKDESGGWWLTCRGSGQKLKIAAGAKDDGVKAIEAGVGEGKKTFKVAGELKTEKRKDGDKEVDVAVIAVATASAL